MQQREGITEDRKETGSLSRKATYKIVRDDGRSRNEGKVPSAETTQVPIVSDETVHKWKEKAEREQERKERKKFILDSTRMDELCNKVHQHIQERMEESISRWRNPFGCARKSGREGWHGQT